jgi:hypothetical protein
MKKNFLLIYAIVLFIASNALLFLANNAGALDNFINIMIVGGMALLGYFGTYIAYLAHRERMKEFHHKHLENRMRAQGFIPISEFEFGEEKKITKDQMPQEIREQFD